MSEIDVTQSKKALPIEAVLFMLKGDFPKLVSMAEAVLEAEELERSQAEEIVRGMITREAAWLQTKQRLGIPARFG